MRKVVKNLGHKNWRMERKLFLCTLPVPYLSVEVKLALFSPKICGTATNKKKTKKETNKNLAIDAAPKVAAG